MREHPAVAYRDCDHCRKWLYDEKTGKVLTRGGVDVERGSLPPPCEIKAVGCAKGHYDNPNTLSARNYMAYIHYKECKAVGRFPDEDGLVRRHASIIAELESTYDRKDSVEPALMLMATMMGTRGGAHGR